MAEPQGLLWPFVHVLGTWHTAMAAAGITRLPLPPSGTEDPLDGSSGIPWKRGARRHGHPKLPCCPVYWCIPLPEPISSGDVRCH